MSATIDVYCTSDEALDRHGMGGLERGSLLVQYLQTRDPKLCRFVAGKHPTKFTVGHIPTSLYLRHVQAVPEAERPLRAFALAVQKIEALDLGSGPMEVRPAGRMSTSAGEVPMWTDEQIDQLPPIYLMEIGTVALERSFLGPSIAGTYQPPPTLARALAQVLARDAVMDGATKPPPAPKSE